jgi:hypothetical protein
MVMQILGLGIALFMLAIVLMLLWSLWQHVF